MAGEAAGYLQSWWKAKVKQDMSYTVAGKTESKWELPHSFKP